MATYAPPSDPAAPEGEQPEPDPGLLQTIVDSLVACARDAHDATDPEDPFDEEAARQDAFTTWLAQRLAVDVQAHLDNGEAA